MKTYILATKNRKKCQEMARILEPLGISVKTSEDAGFGELPEVDETGATYEENAELKARSAMEWTGMPALADDSGLSVDALDGAPGLYSARYAGLDADDGDKIAKLLDAMKDVPAEKRTAFFHSSICCIYPNGEKIIVNGDCYGSIRFEPTGAGGFGYDPVFDVDGKTFAELSAEEKDAVSHRGKALRALKEALLQRGNL